MTDTNKTVHKIIQELTERVIAKEDVPTKTTEEDTPK